ncbi:unnamed protein product [Parnassius apollo]|uniref:(apollo) hypothetical protein n=1 Tax=Parnassius apollo TaxID=110799 RepID=A0A8S3WAV1_PARAO|nr:unnamed protein product [Parnassius apollo]
MGQAGSHPAGAVPHRCRRSNTLTHEPLRHASKVLPSLPESPCLRSTDNGAILQSGGTISGRRPGSMHQESSRSTHGHGHSNVFRSRSAGLSGESGDLRSRERDPLHRSHTNLDIRLNENGSIGKRFDSEPNLRIEEEQQKQRNNNKHFRKKYRAPPPPSNDRRGGSSPDSSVGNARPEAQRKLRLFKTRNETKNINGHSDSKIPIIRNTYTDFKSLDINDQSFERRYKSPCKDKDQHLKYPDNRDMVQSSASLKREERLLQSRNNSKKSRTDVVSGCKAKMSKSNEQSEAWKTPLLDRNFRYSERFKKDDSDHSTLRREKTFDNSLLERNREIGSSKNIFEKELKTLGEQKKLSPLAESSKPLRKSLPSLLPRNEEKDEFQAELKKATSRIRNELGHKFNISENKTSQVNKFSVEKPNPTKTPEQTKVKESSLKTDNANTKKDSKTKNIRMPLSRTHEVKSNLPMQQNKTAKCNDTNNFKFNTKENNRPMPDRGQASGKESTPEHSPTRKREFTTNNTSQQTQKPAPSKQFYFGMIESKHIEPQDHLKDFPGLGSPIIEELNNFHLIEQKLLSYHDDDAELEKFNEKFKEDCKIRNISSESALSSEGSEGEGSDGSLGIALRLRPTLPKKQTSIPHFSPSAAWRQLASLDAHLASETQPLAVETKMSGDISAESSPRSDPSADKSGDSGISGDHAHSDHRIDSPSRHHIAEAGGVTWTPQQDLGDSSSDGAGGAGGAPLPAGLGVATYSPGAQPFSLSLPRENQEKGKQLQQGFNSLQKLRKSVSGALGAALGSRRFDLEHEPMLEEPEQNWFLTKSAPNSLSNPLLFQQPRSKGSLDDDNKEQSDPTEKEAANGWRAGSAYVSWGGHVMYLPPAAQPHSMPALDRPVRSKSSGCLEAAARAARAALAGEMRERERSASPDVARAVPAAVRPATGPANVSTPLTYSTAIVSLCVHRRYQRNQTNANGRGRRFTFQSTVRQLERRRLAEKLSREADLKEQQRKTELEAMRRVEEEFQRKRAREKANIRQQLRLVSSGASSLPTTANNTKARDEPDGSCRASPGARDTRTRHSNTSSETSARSKSTTPIRCVELSEWRTGPAARVYRDWAAAHAHPPACATITHAHAAAHGVEGEAFSGSPRSDNYRLEFARGRSPRTPRAPRLLPTPGSPSSSGSDMSLRPIRIRQYAVSEANVVFLCSQGGDVISSCSAFITTNCIRLATRECDGTVGDALEAEEPAIVPTLRPAGPARPALAIR